MSINWVMLSPSSSQPFTPLPGEQTLFTSPPRIGFAITTPAHYPGKQQQPFSLTHSSGILHLTNRRILYLPDKPSAKLQSFAAPVLNFHDSHVTAPFFGPNVWMALLQPTQGGGIPIPSGGVVEIKFTFKEGGAFDFHTNFERVKERMQQAVEVNGMNSDAARTAPLNVDLEDLPAYQEESEGPLISPVMAPPVMMPAVAPVRQSDVQRDNGVAVEADRPSPKPTDRAFEPPSEPPPGYEETQMQGLQEEADRARGEWRS
ncbi:hypothetical protein LTR56_011520 [Elasticomyces elasticus]|nr:hypothetical protein LTR56_011520 [Elasticomyces elasticus]KAK3643249.1 hypothetical protein LTR22_015716 [Elasticomyces elasticus]KAK5761403.1 hypothetical protein LTS12_008507 [Elasticomyces elasticus]